MGSPLGNPPMNRPRCMFDLDEERQREREMSQKKEADPAILSATAKYRREACIFSSESQDDLVMSLHRQLGRNALLDTSTSFESLPPSFLHCHACGCWLQVGRNGTTLRLRSVGRGNTRRRRASRRKVGKRMTTHECIQEVSSHMFLY